MEFQKEIIYNNNKEKLEKIPSECINRFNERIKFISILESNKVIWEDAEKLSKIWYYIIYYKMKYNIVLYKFFN